MTYHTFKQNIEDWHEMSFTEIIDSLDNNPDLYIALEENITDCEYEEIPLLILDFKQIENVTLPTLNLFKNEVKRLQDKYRNEMEDNNE